MKPRPTSGIQGGCMEGLAHLGTAVHHCQGISEAQGDCNAADRNALPADQSWAHTLRAVGGPGRYRDGQKPPECVCPGPGLKSKEAAQVGLDRTTLVSHPCIVHGEERCPRAGWRALVARRHGCRQQIEIFITSPNHLSWSASAGRGLHREFKCHTGFHEYMPHIGYTKALDAVVPCWQSLRGVPHGCAAQLCSIRSAAHDLSLL